MLGLRGTAEELATRWMSSARRRLFTRNNILSSGRREENAGLDDRSERF